MTKENALLLLLPTGNPRKVDGVQADVLVVYSGSQLQFNEVAKKIA